jgi:hypothetical protein
MFHLVTSLPVTIDWNIVKIKNTGTVISVGNKKVLGLFVETGSLQTVPVLHHNDGN